MKRLLISLVCLPVLNAAASDYTYVDGRGLICVWTKDDVTAVTTGSTNVLGQMSQLAFRVVNVDESNAQYAQTAAIGYKLSANTDYYSYYPYRWYDNFDATRIDCRYDGQQQVGNGCASGLSKYDLSIAHVKTTSSADCTMNYQHLGSVLRITADAPTDMQVFSVAVRADDSCIPTAAKVNLLSKDVEYSDLTDRIEVKASDVVLAEGERFVVYVMMPAVDLSSHDICVDVDAGRRGVFTYSSVKAPNFKAGYLYNLDYSPKADENVMAKADRHAMKASGVEYPHVCTSDILIDPSYVGYVPGTEPVIPEEPEEPEEPETPSAPDEPVCISTLYAKNSCSYYCITGRHATATKRGFLIERSGNGTIRKILRR